VLLLAVAVAVGTGWWGWQRYGAPGPSAAETTLVVARGSGVQAIARQLAEAGVVHSPYDVLVAVKARRLLADAGLFPGEGDGRGLRAGEYAFPAGVSLRGVLDLLETGRTVIRRFTVPEGLTSWQIVELLKADPALTGEIASIPADGTLLPETYHYSFGDSRAELVTRMEQAMRRLLAEAWEGRAPDLPVTTPAQAVILASIVEKETAVAAERPKVAGVFTNRLRLRMKLQSDPTVIYALTGGKGPLDRELTRADWRLEHPYNTYHVAGLPPGPIANPGGESIRAVLNPARHDYLYFVADGTGGHAFAETLDQHNRNVVAWRRIRDGDGRSE
jgi:UPF0755 protein